MLKLLQFLSILATCLVSGLACKTVSYTPQTMPASRIEFGQSGGFTDQRITYFILPNRQLFQYNSLTKVYQTGKKVNSKTFKKLNHQIELLKEHPIVLHERGNMTSYINITSTTRDPISFSWASGSEKELAPELKSLNDILTQLTRSNFKAK